MFRPDIIIADVFPCARAKSDPLREVENGLMVNQVALAVLYVPELGLLQLQGPFLFECGEFGGF